MINSLRIKEICNQVDKKVVAEIGADHGYITKTLFDNNLIKFAYVTDKSSKCLDKAKKNLSLYRDKICFLVGNGLEVFDDFLLDDKNLKESLKDIPEFEQIIIAGMGGQEIIKILKQDKLKKFKHFILQPQQNVVELRRVLQINNFEIIEDEIVKDGKMFYFVLKVKRTNNKQELSENQLMFGNPKNKDVLKSYLTFELKKRQEISNKKIIEENEKIISLIKEELSLL